LNLIQTAEAKITYSNTYSKTENLSKNWPDKIRNTAFEGGFYLDRSIKKILFESYMKKEKKQPVLVVISNDINNAIIENDFAAFKIAFPENNLFYSIDSLGKLQSHSLVDQPKKTLDHDITNLNATVLAYPNDQNPIAFLSNDGEAAIILKKPLFDFEKQNKGKNWNVGFQLEANWISQTLYPEKAKNTWMNAIKQSFSSKIMTPQTSYIVVENEAQKAMIIKKQQDILSGNKSMDLDQEIQGMAEPNILFLLLLISLFLLYQKQQRTSL
jgi:hypothetical protein